MPVSKSTGMNGFCKDRAETGFFFFFSSFLSIRLQIEVYEVCGGGSPRVTHGPGTGQGLPAALCTVRQESKKGKAELLEHQIKGKNPSLFF